MSRIVTVCSDSVGTCSGRLARRSHHGRARRRIRGRHDWAFHPARTEKPHSGKACAVRMRHAGRRRRPRAAVGQVLPGRDDLPALRHRSGLSAPVGRRAPRSRVAGLRPDRHLLSDSASWASCTSGARACSIGDRAGRVPHRARLLRTRSEHAPAHAHGHEHGLDPELPFITTTVRMARAVGAHARRSGRRSSGSRAARSR